MFDLQTVKDVFDLRLLLLVYFHKSLEAGFQEDEFGVFKGKMRRTCYAVLYGATDSQDIVLRIEIL